MVLAAALRGYEDGPRELRVIVQTKDGTFDLAVDITVARVVEIVARLEGRPSIPRPRLRVVS
ncbi:hypothetical protein [Streptomyces sp. NPDC059828]|uniref:hypothetical protein n=1 Tax=Streptomyces sp. NPDC059828 TaxID=3346965 RepID=UPI0036635140